MLETMLAGGAIMWMIFVLSVISVAVVLERVWFFKKASCDAQQLEADIKKDLTNGDVDVFAKTNDPGVSIHRLFRIGYTHRKLKVDELKFLLSQQIRREIYRWEKNLYILEIIGKIAPLLGLLGTVLGMSDMFKALHVGGQVSANAVTGGIWKALFTTIAGLVVAIPTIMAHSILESRIDKEEETLKSSADFIINHLFL